MRVLDTRACLSLKQKEMAYHWNSKLAVIYIVIIMWQAFAQSLSCTRSSATHMYLSTLLVMDTLQTQRHTCSQEASLTKDL